MRGRFLSKLKSISDFTTLKQGLIFHDNTFIQYSQTPKLSSDVKDEENCRDLVNFMETETNVLVSEVNCRDLVNSMETETETETKTNVLISEKAEDCLLLEFEEKCPPGGSDSVILYTTSLRGIRKTFEDCNAIRFLLGSFRISYDERDVSMHLEFREELWRTLGGRVIPPSLFIRGRHIGGVDEVVGLHEQGKLEDLLDGIPRSPASSPCKACGGVRFLLCFSCNGSRKMITEELAKSDPLLPIRCVDCNENGLVKCPVCF